ncbi:MAG: hypothetical protein GY851_12150 [bacterium]|nr:hypothetical protein [bacterium]
MTGRRFLTGFLLCWRRPIQWLVDHIGTIQAALVSLALLGAACFTTDHWFPHAKRLGLSFMPMCDHAAGRVVVFMLSPISALTFAKTSYYGPALLWPYIAFLLAVIAWSVRGLLLHLREDTAPPWHEDAFARTMESLSRRKLTAKKRFDFAEWLGSVKETVTYRQDLAYDASLDPESQVERHARQWLRPRSDRFWVRWVERATPEALFLNAGLVWPLGIPVLAWFAHDYHVGLWIAIGAIVTALAPAAFLGERTLMATPLPLRWRVILTREYGRQLRWQGMADAAAALLVAVIGGSVLLGLWTLVLIEAVRVTGLLSVVVEAAHGAGRGWPAWVNRVTLTVTLAATTVPHYFTANTVRSVTAIDANALQGLLVLFSVWGVQLLVTAVLAFVAVRYTGPAVPGFVSKRGFLRAEMSQGEKV